MVLAKAARRGTTGAAESGSGTNSEHVRESIWVMSKGIESRVTEFILLPTIQNIWPSNGDAMNQVHQVRISRPVDPCILSTTLRQQRMQKQQT